MKNLRIFSLLLLVFPCLASANYTCGGNVVGLTLSPKNGSVSASQIGELVWPILCSVSQELNGVPPDNCKVIYSSLLSAQLAQKTVMFWFNDGKDCTTNSHPAWSTLSGWYFGPRID